MLLASEITPIPKEQALIDRYTPLFGPLHPAAPYHDFAHSRDDVLTEVLRLSNLNRPASERATPRPEKVLAVMSHDIYAPIPLYPSKNFATKEERAMYIAGLVLPPEDYEMFDMAKVSGLVACTRAGSVCETEDEIEMRRGDIGNLGDERIVCLSSSVRLFYEDRQIRARSKLKPRAWPSFMRNQEPVMRALTDQDLTLGFERAQGKADVFNRDATANIDWLCSEAVLDPAALVANYGTELAAVVPIFRPEDFIGQAAA